MKLRSPILTACCLVRLGEAGFGDKEEFSSSSLNDEAAVVEYARSVHQTPVQRLQPDDFKASTFHESVPAVIVNATTGVWSGPLEGWSDSIEHLLPASFFVALSPSRFFDVARAGFRRFRRNNFFANQPTGNWYIGQLMIRQNSQFYRQTNTLPAFFDDLPIKFRRRNLWMSKSGPNSGLHYDENGGNFLCSVVGSKTVVLFHPHDRRRLAMRTNEPCCMSYSSFNMERDTTGKYPDLKNATAFVGKIGPGDCLFIPHHWMHEVKSSAGLNVAVSLPASPLRGDPRAGRSRRGGGGMRRDFARGARMPSRQHQGIKRKTD